MESIHVYRNFLKDTIRKYIDFSQSDQSKGLPPPPIQEEIGEKEKPIPLPTMEEWKGQIKQSAIEEVIKLRKSRRNYNNEHITLEELAFLLWATQGRRNPERNTPHFRTVPSAGARHSFETYLLIHRVEQLQPGVYRYLPLSDEVVMVKELDKSFPAHLNRAVFGQKFVADSAVVFVWTTVPYRMEWRYRQAAHRVILLDAGHVCQNLYLACEAIKAGTCAIAAYDQEAMDELLNLDGENHFTVYLAPVGKH